MNTETWAALKSELTHRLAESQNVEYGFTYEDGLTTAGYESALESVLEYMSELEETNK